MYAYKDIIWNAAVAFTGQDIVKYDLYAHFIGTSKKVPRPKQPVNPKALKTPKAPKTPVIPKSLKAADEPQIVAKTTVGRLGAKLKIFKEQRLHCYCVDPETGAPCLLSYSTMGWLKDHFLNRKTGGEKRKKKQPPIPRLGGTTTSQIGDQPAKMVNSVKEARRLQRERRIKKPKAKRKAEV